MHRGLPFNFVTAYWWQYFEIKSLWSAFWQDRSQMIPESLSSTMTNLIRLKHLLGKEESFTKWESWEGSTQSECQGSPSFNH